MVGHRWVDDEGGKKGFGFFGCVEDSDSFRRRTAVFNHDGEGCGARVTHSVIGTLSTCEEVTYAHGHKKAPDKGGCLKDYRFD